MIIEKLTKWDKNNIVRLAKIFDEWFVGKDTNYHPSPTVNFPRDVDQLIEYGFQFNLTNDVMTHRDKHGIFWTVSCERQNKSTKTVWYKHDENYHRERQFKGGMPQEFFRERFTK